MYLFPFLLLVLLQGCTPEDKKPPLRPSLKEDKEAGIDSLHALQEEPNRKQSTDLLENSDFKAAFGSFFSAFQAADTSTLNNFIHSELGLWLIEQLGAVPKMTRVTNTLAFKRAHQNKSFFTVGQEVKECSLKEEPFPNFDCEALDEGRSGFTKDGCFAWDAENFKKADYWNYAGLSELQVDQVMATLPLVQKSVLHTPTSFEFHFGYVNKEWRLLFAKLIHPCSA